MQARSVCQASIRTCVAWQQKQQKLGSTKLQKKTVTLPAGFLDHCQSAKVWEGSGVQKSEWVMLLSESHLQEIDNALHFFKASFHHYHHHPHPPPPPLLELMTEPES